MFAVIAVIIRVRSALRFYVIHMTTCHAPHRFLYGRRRHLRLIHKRPLQGVHVLELGAPPEARLVRDEVLAHALALLQVAEVVHVDWVMLRLHHQFVFRELPRDLALRHVLEFLQEVLLYLLVLDLGPGAENWTCNLSGGDGPVNQSVHLNLLCNRILKHFR